MNSVRDIQRRNDRELELGLVGSASWHDQFKGANLTLLTIDSAYVYVGGLPFDLTEGDVLTIFSQYGEILNINLPRPREEPKEGEREGQRARNPPRHRGFGFLMYEDQRSTVLAVDNLNGAQVLGRTLRVDHVNSYKQERTRDAEGNLVEPEEETFNCAPPETIVDGTSFRHLTIDEADEDNIDLSDPMAAYFADENKRRRSEKKRRPRDETHDERRHTSRRDRLREHRSLHRSSLSGERRRSPDRVQRPDRTPPYSRQDATP